MADENQPRARDVALDAGRRQRQLEGETAGATRQMLVTTLRLAGHMVGQSPNAQSGGDATARPGVAEKESNPASPGNAPVLADILEVEAGARPNEIARPSVDVRALMRRAVDSALPPASNTVSQAAGDSPRSNSNMHSEGAEATSGAEPPDGVTSVEDVAQWDDTTRPDEPGQIDDALPIESSAAPSDAWPDESDASGDMPLVDDPASLVDSDSDALADDPGLSIEPADPGPLGDWIEPQPAPLLGSSLDSSVFDGDAGLASAGGSAAEDISPDSLVLLDGDSAILHRLPAPGTPHFYPSPGAGNLSEPLSGADDIPMEASGGGRSDSPGTASNAVPSGGDTPNADSKRSLDVTPVRSKEMQTEVTEKLVALINATISQRIDELRHETFVSRAAFSALFPR